MHSYLYLTHELEDVFSLKGMKEEALLTGQFFNAGHVLGSAGIKIVTEENGEQKNLFYTSDTNLRPQHIIPGGSYPEPPIDVLLLETTLGADSEAEQTTRKREEERLLASFKTHTRTRGHSAHSSFCPGKSTRNPGYHRSIQTKESD